MGLLPEVCKPTGHLHGRKRIVTVLFDNSASLHGPSNAYRVNASELWGETTLNVKLVHSPGIFLASWPSAMPLSVKLREAWIVLLTGLPS